MNKLIFAFAFCLIVFVSCETKRGKEKDLLSDSTFVEDTAPKKSILLKEGIQLKYALDKGEILKYRVKTFNRTTQSIISDSTLAQSFTQDINYLFNLKVVDQEENGNLTLNFLCERITAKGESSTGEKLSYDSNNPPKDTSERKQYFNFEILVGSDFSARISLTGEILDIFKMDKIIDKILTEVPRQPTAEEKFQLNNDIMQGVIKPLIQQMFKTVTDKKIYVDSSWANTYPSKLSVFDLENTARYQLKKVYESNGKQIAEIDGSLSVKSHGKTDFLEKGVNYKFEKPIASGTGKIYFDLTHNCISKAESQVSFETVLHISENKAGGKKAKRTDKIESKNFVELLN